MLVFVLLLLPWLLLLLRSLPLPESDTFTFRLPWFELSVLVFVLLF